MVRYGARVLVLVSAVGLFAAIGQAQVANEGFSVVLERAGNKWSMECVTGCSFKSASTTVENPATPMRLDSRGLRTAIDSQPTDARFSFGLTPRGNGWVAIANQGTLWKELSLDCPFSPCRAVVTERGVGLEPARR